MGRKGWANDEQRKFLEGHFATMDRDKQDQTLTVMYARVAAEFIRRWPCPIVRDDESKDWTLAQLKEQADAKKSRVPFRPYFLNFSY